MQRVLKLASAVFLLLAGAAVAQTSIDVPIAEARAIASQAVLSGNPELAAQIAERLLQVDPDDRAALIVLAAAAPMLGRPAQGRLAGARAFAMSSTDPEKYEAARLTALAAANEGRLTLAGWWLRRALTVAPTEADAAQTVADAQGIQNLNPWSSSIQFSFAPSGNVNGGGRNEFNGIDGETVSERIAPGDRALSGWAGTIDLSTRYRLAATQFYQTSLSARAYARGVLLSDEALAFIARESTVNDPAVDNSDYASALFDLGLRHDRLATAGTYGFGLDLGRAYSKAEFDYSFLRLSADRRFVLSQSAEVSLTGSLEQRWDEDDDPLESRYNLQGRWSYSLAGGDVVTASLSYGGIETDRRNTASTSSSLQFGYRLGQAIGPAQVAFSLGVQQQTFPVFYSFSFQSGFFAIDGGRGDIRVFGSVDLFFPDYDYAGFAPVVTLNAGRTDSNVGRFDREDMSVTFAIRSTF